MVRPPQVRAYYVSTAYANCLCLHSIDELSRDRDAKTNGGPEGVTHEKRRDPVGPPGEARSFSRWRIVDVS